MDKTNLADKFGLIKDHWNPRIAGELNGQLIKLVKFRGPFTWHHHETEDELFLVVKGRFRMDFREDGNERGEWIEPGEFIIVPTASNTGLLPRKSAKSCYSNPPRH